MGRKRLEAELAALTACLALQGPLRRKPGGLVGRKKAAPLAGRRFCLIGSSVRRQAAGGFVARRPA